MIAAVVIAAVVMVFNSGPLAAFVERHPTVKMLALSFLLMIGFTLVAGGLHFEIPKGYIYFAMGFSVFVEMLNLRIRHAAGRPVNLRDPYKQAQVLAGEGPVMDIPRPVPVRKKVNQGKKRKGRK
jgi:predicted tellurium resistance membrane protein TerC